MLNLDGVCLIGIGSTHIKETEKAIIHCQSSCRFAESLYLTEKNNHNRSQNKFKYVEIQPITSIEYYQKFVVKELPSILLKNPYPYYLIINWDGFIVNPSAWTNAFFEYDYIGAPWPWMNYVCGNGGFNLKSIKFLKTQQHIFRDIPAEKITEPEDLILSWYFRQNFMDLGCKYAPKDIAYKFSTEHGGYNNHMSFGFHDFQYNPQFKNIITQ